MWSQTISFPQVLRNARLVGAHGEAVQATRHRHDRQALAQGAAPAAGESVEDAGSAESVKLTQHLCQQVAAELSAIESRRQQSLLEMKQVAIEVAVAIASRLLMVQIPAGDQNVANMVHEAVAFFDKPGQLQLFLNPCDLANLDESLCTKAFAAHQSVSLQPDPAVERGNCRVDSDTYAAHFDWQERLEHYRHELLQAVTVNGDG